MIEAKARTVETRALIGQHFNVEHWLVEAIGSQCLVDSRSKSFDWFLS